MNKRPWLATMIGLLVVTTIAVLGLARPHGLKSAPLKSANLTTFMRTTNQAGQHDRIHQVHGTSMRQLPANTRYIQVLPNQRRQCMTGVGGALTDSAAAVLRQATPSHRRQILHAYFSSTGAHYTNVRLTIGSCDFSTFSYDYESKQSDPSLRHFSMKAENRNVRPMLQQIQAIQPHLALSAAPWAPPAWMKVSQRRAGQNFLVNNQLKPAMKTVYAAYLVKYLQNQRAHGINIETLSLQNELQASSAWESMTWSPDQAASFITHDLGPKLRQAGLPTRIIVWDYVRSDQTEPVMMGFNQWTTAFYRHPGVKKYVTGIGIHWYAANLDPQMALGNLFKQPAWDDNFTNLTTFHRQEPTQQIMATEATQERGIWLHSWTPAARYSYDIINDFNHDVTGYLDWNLVLNGAGGPTHKVTNPCSAPINVLHPGTSHERVVINPSYYILKRVSRDVQPGTVSVKSRSNVTGIDQTAIQQPDHSVRLLINNRHRHVEQITVVSGHQAYQVRLTPQSFNAISLPAVDQQTTISTPPALKTAPVFNGLKHVWSHWILPLLPLWQVWSLPL
ncbi:glycoside hydrolase family 30 protein [Furfurilactobacillus curtus]|uniref:Glycosyl hydrolase n=1 Tax=Furfurilactobacillus curtus TaxID=1746200 RepID=A0ABQ5JLN6_9LACO